MRLLLAILIFVPYLVLGQNEIRFHLSEHTTEIETLKFYISEVNIDFEDGSQLELKEPAYLIDFEGNENVTISIGVDKKISTIDFILGTDSTINVAGILSGDLDPILGMYWAWNTGYINFKLEGKDALGEFEYHIGGYLTPYPTHRSIHVSSNQIEIDVDAWLHSASGINRQIMIPGKEASQLADLFPLLFNSEK